jgi:hypothetical protein
MKRDFKTVMVNNSTNINNTNTYLLPKLTGVVMVLIVW